MSFCIVNNALNPGLYFKAGVLFMKFKKLIPGNYSLKADFILIE
jgi:hypothetical protein